MPASVADSVALLHPRDWRQVEADYLAAETSRYLVIDDLLIPGALAQLRDELCSHHAWGHKAPTSRELYLAQPGGTTEILARELMNSIPAILVDLTLVDHWAYLHSQDAGIKPHTDAGRVTVNLYLTEDRHNLLPGRSGLRLTSVSRPSSVSPVEFSTPPWSDEYFEREFDGREVRVPYRCNRAVIFDARHYHGSDTLSFARTSTSAMRLNVGLLFDDPERASARETEFNARLETVIQQCQALGIEPRSVPLACIESWWKDPSPGPSGTS